MCIMLPNIAQQEISVASVGSTGLGNYYAGCANGPVKRIGQLLNPFVTSTTPPSAHQLFGRLDALEKRRLLSIYGHLPL